MSPPIEVVAYSGYRGEQEPRVVVLDGERLAVREIRRRWRSPEGRHFEVEVTGGRRLVLRCGGGDPRWSLSDPVGSGPLLLDQPDNEQQHHRSDQGRDQ